MAISLPTLLSYERKLETSDGLMSSGNWQDINNEHAKWLPIAISKRYNRSTQSAHGTSDANKIKPNPVSASNDDANLPLDNDTLKVSFSVRVIGNLGLPFACNSPDFEQAITDKLAEFKDTDLLDELAKRYAYNIANGRFLWRNRVGAEAVEINVNVNTGEKMTFKAYDYGLNNFDNTDDNIKTLANAIKNGLKEDTFVLVNVDAYVKLGNGQHVFPSQEMNMGEKRKSLFKINDQAGMHNVKIGNAIRTIDDWYPDAITPIAIEPFGAVTQRGQAYRKSKIDLYTLLVNWVNDKELTDDEKIYVVANLIRGGVFSKGGND